MPAVLEQWEIDLRNQLLEGSQSECEWEERLRNELQNVPTRKNRKKDKEPINKKEDDMKQSPFAPHKHKKKEDNYVAYYFIIFVLILLGLFVYNQKSGGNIAKWFENRIQIANPNQPALQSPTLPSMPPDKSVEVTQLQTEVAKLKQDMDVLSGKVKWNSDRITLMGMVLNENFVITGNNYDRSHLIFFNANWTIDKMPRYLELQEKDKEYLQKFVKSR